MGVPPPTTRPLPRSLLPLTPAVRTDLRLWMGLSGGWGPQRGGRKTPPDTSHKCRGLNRHARCGLGVACAAPGWEPRPLVVNPENPGDEPQDTAADPAPGWPACGSSTGPWARGTFLSGRPGRGGPEAGGKGARTRLWSKRDLQTAGNPGEASSSASHQGGLLQRASGAALGAPGTGSGLPTNSEPVGTTQARARHGPDPPRAR